MHTFHAYAANSAKTPLKPFSFDPGELGPEEVEINVTHCGLCHSDLSMLDDDWGMSKYPFVPGHEVVGTVAALGDEAKGLKIGQRVGLGWWSHSCLSCHQCLSGNHNLCSTAQGTIVGRHGGFADRVRAQWTWVRPIPKALDLAKTGPLLCGGVTVFAPFLIHNVPSTARVGVIGIGGLGHMALQFANKWGCEVHAFTTSDSKEAEAAAGVKLVGESDQPSKTIPPLQLKKLLVPTDFSKNSEKALRYAVRLAQRNNSSLILFHVFEPPEFVRQLPQDYSESSEETRKQFDAAIRRSAERLETLSGAVKGSNIKIETLQRLGTPYEEIVKVAEAGEVDLIVIATHGYTGLKHFLLGSTAERVVRLAPCPVLVVREQERDFVSQKEGPG